MKSILLLLLIPMHQTPNAPIFDKCLDNYDKGKRRVRVRGTHTSLNRLIDVMNTLFAYLAFRSIGDIVTHTRALKGCFKSLHNCERSTCVRTDASQLGHEGFKSYYFQH